MSFRIAYGLGPYVSQLTITDIMKGQSFFTLLFDETVIAHMKKQMDLLVCYWPGSEGQVPNICYVWPLLRLKM